MLVSIVIPAKNEERTIAQILSRVLDSNTEVLGIRREVLVVDDGSTDRTAAIVSEHFPQVRLLRVSPSRGKGAAMRLGLEHAAGEYLLVQDADLEYDPVDYARLLEPLVRERVPAVYGSRFLSRRYPVKMLKANYVGNILATLLVNALYRSRLSDLMTGYKVISIPLLKELRLTACGFEICPELTAKLLKRNVPIMEVPISYQGRTKKDGKKIALKDGMRIWSTLWKCRFKNERTA
jgi:glycosyltransferase involved in cell wall biosynthesis